MSDLSIGSSLTQNQILQLLQQQLVGNADKNSTGASHQQDAASAGQSLPGGTKSSAPAASTTGASQPAVDPQTTLALLKIQESQMMASTDTLIFGNNVSGGTSTGDPLLDAFGGGNAAQTDPLQSIIDQMTGAGAPNAASLAQLDPSQILSALSAMTGSASDTNAAQASNQSLLDILNQTAATTSETQASES